jgi:hypothetical protein
MGVLMTLEDWNRVKHFNPDENWGDWTKLEKNVIFLLDRMREDIGRPIKIHCAYDSGGHSTQSQHYLGRAVDYHIKNTPLLEQYLLAERYGWRGIGLYTDWNNPGLHSDLRRSSDDYDDLTLYRGARWGRRKKWQDGEMKTIYVPLDQAFIKHVIEGGY